MMGKKAVIVVSLIEESAERPNEEIEREIMEELLRKPARIPWLKKVEKVTVYLFDGQHSTKGFTSPKGGDGWVLIDNDASGFVATFNAKIFWTATKPMASR